MECQISTSTFNMNYKNSNKRIYSNSLHSDINFFFSFHCQINILRILLQNNYNNSYGMKWLLVLNKMCGLVGVMTKATNRFFFNRKNTIVYTCFYRQPLLQQPLLERRPVQSQYCLQCCCFHLHMRWQLGRNIMWNWQVLLALQELQILRVTAPYIHIQVEWLA